MTRLFSYHIADEIRDGRLQMLLGKDEHPPLPVHLLAPQGRLSVPKVRAFVDFAAPRLKRYFTRLSNEADKNAERHSLAQRKSVCRIAGIRTETRKTYPDLHRRHTARRQTCRFTEIRRHHGYRNRRSSSSPAHRKASARIWSGDIATAITASSPTPARSSRPPIPIFWPLPATSPIRRPRRRSFRKRSSASAASTRWSTMPASSSPSRSPTIPRKTTRR